MIRHAQACCPKVLGYVPQCSSHCMRHVIYVVLCGSVLLIHAAALSWVCTQTLVRSHVEASQLARHTKRSTRAPLQTGGLVSLLVVV